MSNKGGRVLFPNRLWTARKRKRLGQKQVGVLIDRTVAEVSRYERGIHLPELEILIALEIVYGTPLRLLFPEIYEKVRARITKRIESSGMSKAKTLALPNGKAPEQYCGYEEMLKLPALSAVERDKVRAHVIRLMRQMTDT